MGRGAAPARRRSTWAAAGPLLLLFAVLLSASSIKANPCSSFCSCTVVMQLFRHVSCERATLYNIPQDLPSKNATTLLNLQRNQMKILRGNSLENFKQLQYLNLDNNKLIHIDTNAFQHCPQLRLLRLAHNELRELDVDLFRNISLQFLDLSYNKLILPSNGPFLRSRFLLILNLTSTYLSNIPVNTFSELQNLNRLDLSLNMLQQVNVKALNMLKGNVSVQLSENPLRCDCELKKTWEWAGALGGAGTCNSPQRMRGKPWSALRNLDCAGEAGAGASAGTYALYAIAALLVVIAVLVALLVWGIRRRRRKNAAASGGGGSQRRKQRLAPPVGEYIEVLADMPNNKQPIYEALPDPKAALPDPKKDPDGGRRGAAEKEDVERQRYVTDISRNTYLPPVKPSSEGPIYVNMKGPPLPLRQPSDVPSAPSVPAPTKQGRPCSIPLLEGCDFYEVVD